MSREPPRAAVGWPAAFAVLGALCGMGLNALSAVDPAAHHHSGSLAAATHALLLAAPLAFLLAVLLRLPERALFVGLGLAIGGAVFGALV
ncbi:MAG: hypothetical protein QOE90_2799 [Thermoplasmata archaeon]|jgi:hypothetical protein|nr:hypothetical protein [Thermoplasmata archaeon]